MFNGVAIAAGVININRTRRAPNCFREGCVSSENEYFSLRLRQNEVQAVALEYVQWRRQAGANVKYYSGLVFASILKIDFTTNRMLI